MTWFLNLFLLKTHYPHVGRYLPIISTLVGSVGAIALMGSTATLDTGKHDVKLHVKCATSFFLLTIFASIYNTFVSVIVEIRTHSFGIVSTVLKVVLSVLMAIWVYLDLTKGEQTNSTFGNIAEYTLAFLILGYVLVIAWDLRKFRLEYTLNTK